MSERKDGGPAFPVSARWADWIRPGMTLRDWFAGQAIMTAVLDDPNSARPAQSIDIPRLATTAYMIADALLAERSKSQEPST